MVVDNLPNPSGHPDCTMYTLCTGMYLRMLCIGTKSFNFYFSDSPEWTGTGTPNILEPPSSGFHRFNENEVWLLFTFGCRSTLGGGGRARARS